MAQQLGKHIAWHRFLVIGDGQPALRHVEDTLGRAAIVQRIMQHALANAVGSDDVRFEDVTIRGQGEGSGQTIAI